MYNRYIPQPDGSYRRNRMPDNSRPVQRPRQQNSPMEPPCPPPPPETCEPVRQEPCSEPKQEKHRMPNSPLNGSVGSFLRQLLPKDFDTGDLLIILLLLLMAGDCQEDRGTALLTLALYLFM